MYDFLKFTERRYAEDILNGKLYMNPLSFFKQIKGEHAQFDSMEGFADFIPREQAESLFPNEPIFEIAEKIGIINETNDIYNIFCLYSLFYDDTKKVLKPISKTFFDPSNFGDCCVYIYDSIEFIRRVTETIKRKCEESELTVGTYGHVRYVSLTDDIGPRSIFDKMDIYSDQNEWRLAVASIYSLDTPIILEIGDIHDIARIIPVDNLLEEIDRMYPLYRCCLEGEPSYSATSIYCDRIVANHFLNSFLPSKYKENEFLDNNMQIIANCAKNFSLEKDIEGGIEYLKGEYYKTRRIEVIYILMSFLEQNRLAYKEKIFWDFFGNLFESDRDFCYSRNGFLVALLALKLIPTKFFASFLLVIQDHVKELTEEDRKDANLIITYVLECYNSLNCYDTNGNLLEKHLHFEMAKRMYMLDWEGALEIFKHHSRKIENHIFGFRGLTYQLGVLLEKGIPQHNKEAEELIAQCIHKAKECRCVLVNKNRECLLSELLLLKVVQNRNFGAFNKFRRAYITTLSVRTLIDWYVNTGEQLVYDILVWLRDNRSKLSFISPNMKTLASLYYVAHIKGSEEDDLFVRLLQLELQMDFEDIN